MAAARYFVRPLEAVVDCDVERADGTALRIAVGVSEHDVIL